MRSPEVLLLYLTISGMIHNANDPEKMLTNLQITRQDSQGYSGVRE